METKPLQWAGWNPVGLLLNSSPVVDPATQEITYQHPIGDGVFLLGRLKKLNVQTLPDGRIVHDGDTGYFKHTALVTEAGLEIPSGSEPGAWPYPEGDSTNGSTKKGDTGPRVFFYAIPLAKDANIPGLDLTKYQRALLLKWVSLPADVGIRGELDSTTTKPVDPATATPAIQPAVDDPLAARVGNLNVIVNSLPAAPIPMTPAEATYDPTDS